MTDSKSRCVDGISTDTRPIVYLTIDRLSTHYRPTIDRLSTDYRLTIDQLSTDYRPTIDQLSTNHRPTVDRLSTDCRPLYRPLCRPISQSTLPTVNKIGHISSCCHGVTVHSPLFFRKIIEIEDFALQASL